MSAGRRARGGKKEDALGVCVDVEKRAHRGARRRGASSPRPPTRGFRIPPEVLAKGRGISASHISVDARLARGRTRRTWRRPAPGPPGIRSESASRGPRFARRSSSWPAGARAPLPPAPADRAQRKSARTKGQPSWTVRKRADITVRNSPRDAQSKSKDRATFRTRGVHQS